MSRHGSGKRRRTSPEEPARPDPRQPDEPYGPHEHPPGADDRYRQPEQPAQPEHHDRYRPYEQPEPPAGATAYAAPTGYDYDVDSGEYIAIDAGPTDPATAQFPAVTDVPTASTPAPQAPEAQHRPVSAPEPEPEPEPEPAQADTGKGLRPSPPPLEGNIVRFVAAGSIVWFALFVTALFGRGGLGDDRAWWPWCALAGAGLGLIGLWYCRRLREAAED